MYEKIITAILFAIGVWGLIVILLEFVFRKQVDKLIQKVLNFISIDKDEK